MKEVIKKNPSPGISISVIKDGKIVHLAGYGKEEINRAVEMTPESTMDIGSITKSMTAIAILQLVESGKLDLDAKVTKYLPWFRTSNKEKSDLITVRMLLNNTSGLVNLGKSTAAYRSMSSATMKAVAADLSSSHLDLSPGESYAYSNYGFHVAGLIISEVSGLDYFSYMCENIFRPLGMAQTSLDPNVFNNWSTKNGHGYGINGIIPHPKKAQGAAFVAAGRMTKSNARDMANYMLMLLQKGTYKKEEIITENSALKLANKEINFQGLSNFIGCEGDDWHYGFGLMKANIENRDLIFHGGSSGTTSSIMLLNPDSKTGVFVLSNLDQSYLSPFGAYDKDITIANNILRILEGQSTSDFGRTCQKDETSNSYDLPSEDRVDYLGSYFIQEGGEDLVIGSANLLIEEKDDVMAGSFVRDGQVVSSFEIDFVNPLVAIARSKFGRAQIFKFAKKSNGKVLTCDFGHTVYKKQKASIGKLQEYAFGDLKFQLSEQWLVEESGEEFLALNNENRIIVNSNKSLDIKKHIGGELRKGPSKLIRFGGKLWTETVLSSQQNGKSTTHWQVQNIEEPRYSIILSSPSEDFYSISQNVIDHFFKQKI